MKLPSWLRAFSRKKKKKIVPKCISGYRWMIDSTGQFRPCCWIDPRDFDHPEFNITNKTLDEVFSSEPFKEFTAKLYRYETAPEGCQRACGQEAAQSRFVHAAKESYGYGKKMKIFHWGR